MPGRKFSANNSYRYGFNGQEKSDEIDANFTTAQYWEYDSRTGRRWNVDPVIKVWESPYATFANNPILFTDINGDKIKNGDKENVKVAEKDLQLRKDYLAGIMKDNKITEGMSKKEFLKSGGTIEQWKEYTRQVNYVKEGIADVKKYTKQAEITEKVIAEWQKNAPNIFKEVDGKNVDFILFTKDIPLDVDGVAGSNGISYTGTDDNPNLYATMYDNLTTVPNSVGVLISQNVNFKDPDNTIDYIKSDGTITNKQFLLNHEAGHFLYIISATSIYIKFQKAVKAKGESLEGGHRKDDESGKNAVKYGSVKDF